MLSAEIMKWVVLILAVGVVVLIIKAGMKILNILITAAVLAFAWFSFFTEEGAARLTIALNGKPLTAYTTKLEKQEHISTNEVTYFKSSKDVVIKGEKQEYVKCYTKWIVRIPSVGE